MEPFRPLVDWKVKQLVDEGKTEVTPEVKKYLAGILKLDLPTLRGKSCLSNCLLNLAQSLVKSFEHKKPQLEFPKSMIPLKTEYV